MGRGSSHSLFPRRIKRSAKFLLDLCHRYTSSSSSFSSVRRISRFSRACLCLDARMLHPFLCSRVYSLHSTRSSPSFRRERGKKRGMNENEACFGCRKRASNRKRCFLARKQVYTNNSQKALSLPPAPRVLVFFESSLLHYSTPVEIAEKRAV